MIMKRLLQRYLSVTVLPLLFFGCSKDPVLSGTISSQILVSIPVSSGITQTTVTCSIQVSGGFSGDITGTGLCWSTNSGPTILDKTVPGTAEQGTGILSISGLTPGTTYYVRAYCRTNNDIIYGAQKIFQTLSYQLATISTVSVSGITRTTALCGGNITATGGGSVSSKGVCWSTTSLPTVQGNKTVDGSGPGIFNSNLSGLSAGTLYYIRAYAINEAGTAYGQQLSFRTASPAIATVSGTTVSLISQNSAFATATISTSDNSPVIVKGICWSVYSSPTTANSGTGAGSSTGSFAVDVSGLSPNTLYYIRAYATTETGTVYGAQTSFRTSNSGLAALSSVAVTSISSNSAFVTASITDGTYATSRGVCWSTGTNPTLQSGLYFSNGVGTGAISGNLTGLISGRVYYLRAYAVNSYGTSYGPLTLFQTQ